MAGGGTIRFKHHYIAMYSDDGDEYVIVPPTVKMTGGGTIRFKHHYHRHV